MLVKQVHSVWGSEAPVLPEMRVGPGVSLRRSTGTQVPEVRKCQYGKSVPHHRNSEAKALRPLGCSSSGSWGQGQKGRQEVWAESELYGRWGVAWRPRGSHVPGPPLLPTLGLASSPSSSPRWLPAMVNMEQSSVNAGWLMLVDIFPRRAKTFLRTYVCMAES